MYDLSAGTRSGRIKFTDMFTQDVPIRVRYADTDQMGYVYYGKYAEYFEVGRVEALRTLDVRYRDLEKEQGIMLPVVVLNVRYKAPAFYDEHLIIRTSIREMPTRLISFEHQVLNEEGKLLTEGETKLVFVDIKSGKSVQAPEALKQKLGTYFES